METSNKVSKNRFTSEEIQEFILQWKQSGMNRRKFCDTHGFNYYTFGTWLEKVNNKETAPAGFTEVKLKNENTVFARLVLSNGLAIDFYQRVPAEYLQSFLK